MTGPLTQEEKELPYLVREILGRQAIFPPKKDVNRSKANKKITFLTL